MTKCSPSNRRSRATLRRSATCPYPATRENRRNDENDGVSCGLPRATEQKLSSKYRIGQTESKLTELFRHITYPQSLSQSFETKEKHGRLHESIAKQVHAPRVSRSISRKRSQIRPHRCQRFSQRPRAACGRPSPSTPRPLALVHASSAKPCIAHIPRRHLS